VRSHIQKLSSDATERRQEAAIKLLDLGKESAGCRDVVINEVMSALSKADLDNDDSAFHLWATGSGILGRLKAVEALDLLIAHLDLTDGLFSASLAHEPVVLAMEKMGEVAVPKLAVALKTNPKTRIRLAAALCLSLTGGSEAVEALNSALVSEPEACVRRLVSLLLREPEKHDSNRPFTTADGELFRQRLQAYACNK
jgi:hypothetical protein